MTEIKQLTASGLRAIASHELPEPSALLVNDLEQPTELLGIRTLYFCGTFPDGYQDRGINVYPVWTDLSANKTALAVTVFRDAWEDSR